MPFGFSKYVSNKAPGKGKYEPRSEECIFVYLTELKKYWLWNTTLRKIIKAIMKNSQKFTTAKEAENVSNSS